MVNGINSNFYVQNVQANKPQTIQENRQQAVTNPIDNYTMKGLESLGIYNMSLIKNKNDFEHKPAELILPKNTEMDQVEGKKVCNPYGQLEYVVADDGKFETKYYPDENAPEKVGKIQIRDLYSGKILKEQNSESAYNWTEVLEYPEDESDTHYRTLYRSGRVENIEKVQIFPDGSRKCYSKDLYMANPTLTLTLASKNYKDSIDVQLDSKNNVKSIRVGKQVGNTEVNKNIELNKGAVIGVTEFKNTTVPNFMERDVLNDADVMPTEKFDKDKIENIAKNSPSDVYSFYGNGSLKELNDGNIRIEFSEDGSQKITEYLGDNKTKITDYQKDGETYVTYKDGKITKSLDISSENKPITYNIAEGDKCVRAATFTDQGYLKWCE